MIRKFLFSGLLIAAIGLPQLALAQAVVIEDDDDDVPDEVTRYSPRESVPSVTVPGDVVVGWTVPPSVQLRTVPSNERYNYAVVNGQSRHRVAADSKGDRRTT